MALAVLNRLHKHGQGDFSLIQHLEVSQLQFGSIRGRAGEGPPDGDGQAPGLGFADLDGHIRLLHDHPGDDHQFRPVPLRFADLAHIAVHQLHLPLLGKQGSHRDQAQGGQEHLAVHQLQDLFVAPEGLGKFGVDEERAHAGAGTPK